MDGNILILMLVAFSLGFCWNLGTVWSQYLVRKYTNEESIK